MNYREILQANSDTDSLEKMERVNQLKSQASRTALAFPSMMSFVWLTNLLRGDKSRRACLALIADCSVVFMVSGFALFLYNSRYVNPVRRDVADAYVPVLKALPADKQ